MEKKKSPLKTQLTSWFLVCGIIPMLIVAVIGYVVANRSLIEMENLGEDALTDGAEHSLLSLRESKRNEVGKYFEERQGDMGVLLETVNTLRTEAFKKLGAVSEYKIEVLETWVNDRIADIHSRAPNPLYIRSSQAMLGTDADAADLARTELLNEFKVNQRLHGYYNEMMILDLKGIPLVSLTGSTEDFSELNCFRGALSNARSTMKGGECHDLFVGPIEFSEALNSATICMGHVIRDPETFEPIAVLTANCNIDKIDGIMQNGLGLGETGESYLVGSDKMMRSNARLVPTKTIFEKEVDSAGVQRMFAERDDRRGAGFCKNEIYEDYRGQLVLAHNHYLRSLDVAVITEIDLAEAFCPKDEQGIFFLDKYKEMYGYYDVFLIDPNGYCFFSSEKESDDQSNFVNGKYSNSNLGKAVQECLKTKQFVFADFAPYEPSGDLPCAFIVQPLVVDGRVEMVVALQLSADEINAMMASGSDASKTLGAYLVGADGFLRTDTQLNHTPKTVANSVGNKVKMISPSVKSALEGRSGAEVITLVVDGEDQAVFSAYSPIEIYGERWVLVCEQDEAVALSAAGAMKAAGGVATGRLRWVSWITGGIAFLCVGAVGLLIGTSIANQVAKRDAEIHRVGWIKSGQGELNDAVRGDLGITTLLHNAITSLSEYSGAKIGAVYLMTDDRLKLLSSYAFSKRKNVSNTIGLGEGIVGQAALEKKSILLTDVPEDYIAVQSGLGETPPRNIMVIPLIHEEEVKGVVELGSLTPFTDTMIEYLELATEGLAIAIHTAQAKEKVQVLLEQTQEQAEELEAQQEELRQSNEELEEQTKSLQESEERLRVQQEELEETNTNLEERTDLLEKQRAQVKQQNEELANARDRIEEKAEELEITSKYKSEFLANMSHELRTPLNSMLILSKMLANNKKNHLDEKETEFAKTINNSGTSLLTLINEILDLSKIESGKIELDIQEMKLQSFLSDLKQVFEPIANDKKLDFNIEVADDVPATIRTDEQRLGQIIKNLLSNALKFTTEGSVTVSIDHPADGAIADSPTPRPLQIRVKDTGVGIPEDKQKLIFEAFQQADGSTSRKFGGTGLGLSISRELAKLLGGEIRIESTSGEGSTFILLIPLESVVPQQNVAVRATPAPAPSAPAPAPAPTPKPAIVKKAEPVAPPPVANSAGDDDDRNHVSTSERSILIVEDDETFANVMLELVREKDFKGIVAPTGEEGLRLAREHKPSAILMDIGLPGMDGLAVLDRLKEDVDLRHIPIHMISGHDKELDSFRRGAAGFLRKPISTEQLDTLMFDPIERIISGATKKLLLVEDDPASRMSIEALLVEKDIEITQAGSGEEALKRLEAETFDCMVLDLGLPDMNGMAVLEKIKESNTIGHVPVVVFTGRDLTSDEQGVLDSYAERIVVKGVKSQERLLDETALFLHRVEADLPEEKKKMIRMLHDKETIFRDKKILVVDDDMRNVFALSSVLEEKGMIPVIAKNGQEALDMLEKTQGIDLVLMDIMMPIMDGYEAMRNIRDRKTNIKYSNVPILALTAKAMKGDRVKCIEAGANDYIAKPVDVEKLFSVMRVWLYQ